MRKEDLPGRSFVVFAARSPKAAHGRPLPRGSSGEDGVAQEATRGRAFESATLGEGWGEGLEHHIPTALSPPLTAQSITSTDTLAHTTPLVVASPTAAAPPRALMPASTPLTGMAMP